MALVACLNTKEDNLAFQFIRDVAFKVSIEICMYILDLYEHTEVYRVLDFCMPCSCVPITHTCIHNYYFFSNEQRICPLVQPSV